MLKFVMAVAVAVGAALAGPAAAQSPGSTARQPTHPVLPQTHQSTPSKPVQSDAERERVAREQGLSQAELYRRRESGLDEGQPLRR